MSDPDRYKSRGRKERTPEQLKVLEMAREKARLVIAERTKIKREMTEPPPEPEPAEPEETEPPTPPSESEPTDEPEPEPIEEAPPPPPPAPPPVEPSMSREEIQTLIHSTLNPPERKYQYINGAYVKIK